MIPVLPIAVALGLLALALGSDSSGAARGGAVADELLTTAPNGVLMVRQDRQKDVYAALSGQFIQGPAANVPEPPGALRFFSTPSPTHALGWIVSEVGPSRNRHVLISTFGPFLVSVTPGTEATWANPQTHRWAMLAQARSTAAMSRGDVRAGFLETFLSAPNAAPDAGVKPPGTPPNIAFPGEPGFPLAKSAGHLRLMLQRKDEIAASALGKIPDFSPTLHSALLIGKLGLYPMDLLLPQLEQVAGGSWDKTPWIMTTPWFEPFHSARIAGAAWSACIGAAAAAAGDQPVTYDYGADGRSGTGKSFAFLHAPTWNHQIELEREVRAYFVGPPPYGFAIPIPGHAWGVGQTTPAKVVIFDFSWQADADKRGETIAWESHYILGLSSVDAAVAGASAADQIKHPKFYPSGGPGPAHAGPPQNINAPPVSPWAAMPSGPMGASPGARADFGVPGAPVALFDYGLPPPVWPPTVGGFY